MKFSVLSINSQVDFNGGNQLLYTKIDIVGLLPEHMNFLTALSCKPNLKMSGGARCRTSLVLQFQYKGQGKTAKEKRKWF